MYYAKAEFPNSNVADQMDTGRTLCGSGGVFLAVWVCGCVLAVWGCRCVFGCVGVRVCWGCLWGTGCV